MLRCQPIVKRSTRRLSPRVRCLCGILTLALLVPLAGATAASADPISDKKSQASQLAQELQAKSFGGITQALGGMGGGLGNLLG